MLFNTLAFATFFGVVFTTAWLLVRRAWALALPWLTVGGYVGSRPFDAQSATIAAASLFVTVALCRSVPDDERPGAARAGASVLANLGALWWLTSAQENLDPVVVAARALGVPMAVGWWSSPAVALAGVAAYFLVRARRVRLVFILGASYVFYAHWDWRFLPLIFASSSVDWLLGNRIAGARSDRSRKAWLAGTVIVNLGVLGVFKYFNFGVDTARVLLSSLGMSPPDVVLRVALPVGISFFTFESMSYVIDVYRRDIEPHGSYVEYLAFVAFFPHLVAGPIVRPRDLLPQLAGPPRFSAVEGSEGLFLIAIGLFKKIAIGDYLALNLVDRVFDAPLQYSALECYAAVLGYSVQIYCDFSGYTDIAIGCALLLGVRFPLNFDAPYKALDVQDFWRRWHISLSTWLRDYLYIPLGGNRRGEARTYANLMITMVLGGLWHGAAWTFVVWGGLHGTALALTRWYRATHPQQARSPVRSVLAVLLTFHFVCAAWIFFRAETFQKAWIVFDRLVTFTTFHPNLHAPVLGVLALGLVSHWVPERWYAEARDRFIRAPAFVQGYALLVVAFALRELASADAVPFVYFQF